MDKIRQEVSSSLGYFPSECEERATSLDHQASPSPSGVFFSEGEVAEWGAGSQQAKDKKGVYLYTTPPDTLCCEGVSCHAFRDIILYLVYHNYSYSIYI